MDRLKILASFSMAAVCAGCISSHVSWVEGFEPEVPDVIEGSCRFSGGDELSSCVAARLNAVARQDGDEIPMTIYFKRGEAKPANGLLAKVNNVFSFFTLGLWPWVRSQEQPCTVEVVALSEKMEKEFVVGHRVWSSFVLPIGIIPCPAVVPDWRSYPTLKLDFGRGPDQEDWEADVSAGFIGELLTKEQLDKLRNRRSVLRNK